ncbi:esterase FE4-like [Zerene cesonia]|uniref:esterase FE4-like n=1 Tax=Zerene cesonia TaxID=33412 RepID=UPI0018E59E79|nr:esterase FE4-like [Zerene cesonia]
MARIFFLCVSLFVCVYGHKQDDIITESASGRFVGSLMTSRRGRPIHAYRGIRYAQPPVGALRFQPPVPITFYPHEVNATLDGPACPQPADPGYFVDEDCLRLNVYTPGVLGKWSLPVLVYIHAGGFYSVSGRSDVAGPQHLLDKDLVLVTINYRLGSLGFLSTGDEHAPGNNGFKDQVVALQWVRANIASFGGDAGRVTLAGYSAGAISVALHTVSPMSRGLFHRAISMSGSPFSQIPFRCNLLHLAVQQARLVDCPVTSTAELVDCLRAVPWRVLGDSLKGFQEFSIDPILIWTPVIEGDFGQERFLPEDPLRAIRAGKLRSVPYIVSQTRDEFFWESFLVLNNSIYRTQINEDWYKVGPEAFLLPAPSDRSARALRAQYLPARRLENTAADNAALGRLYGDAVIGFGAHRLANLMAYNNKEPTYYYEFNYIGNQSHYVDPASGKPVGVAHHDELIYLFSLPAGFQEIPVSDSRDSLMVDKLTTMFYNFALTGNPNPLLDDCASPVWPPMRPDERQYLQIGDHFSVHRNLFENRFRVWEYLYPIEYNLTKS